MKTLCCRDAGFDCEGEIHAATEEEILRQASEHAQAYTRNSLCSTGYS